MTSPSSSAAWFSSEQLIPGTLTCRVTLGMSTKVFGTEDQVAKQSQSEANKKLLPATTTWVRVEGGNHAQFGWYGGQPGDGKAKISRDANSGPQGRFWSWPCRGFPKARVEVTLMFDILTFWRPFNQKPGTKSCRLCVGERFGKLHEFAVKKGLNVSAWTCCFRNGLGMDSMASSVGGLDRLFLVETMRENFTRKRAV